MQQIWYVAYRSNLSYNVLPTIFGAARSRERTRVPRMPGHQRPARERQAHDAGQRLFRGAVVRVALGYGLYDPDATGEVAARAYRITAEQFVDVLAQETRRTPGVTLDLAPALPRRSLQCRARWVFGLVRIGDRDGLPLMTFTADRRAKPPLKPPSAAYLSAMATGLEETHGRSGERIDRYLTSLPGIMGPVRAPVSAATG